MPTSDGSTQNPHFTKLIIASVVSMVLIMATVAAAFVAPRFLDAAILACVLAFIAEGVYAVQFARSTGHAETGAGTDEANRGTV